MKRNSWKKSLWMGITAGAISYGLYLLMVYVSGALTGWQHFFQPDMSVKTYGTLRWETVAAAGVVLTSLVPVITLRYEKVKDLLLYLLVSLAVFVWLYGAVLLGFVILAPDFRCPFMAMDAIYDLIAVVPIGSMIGTLAAIVCRWLNREKR